MNNDIITNTDPRTAEEKLHTLKFYYNTMRQDNYDKVLYIASVSESIDKAVEHIKSGDPQKALSELTNLEIIRRPVKEKVMQFEHLGGSTWLEAYEEPETKNLYLVPTIDGYHEIRSLQSDGDKSYMDILNLLVSDDSPSALTGNGWEIVDPGYQNAFTLGYDMDYSDCPDDNDDNVKYGRLWEFAEYYIWDPIEKMLEDGYLMLHYYYDENMSIQEEEDTNVGPPA